MDYEAVIGLEVHVQLATESKMFCRCRVNGKSNPNSNICPVCLGLPGALPSINGKVLDFAIKLGLATNCRINHYSQFARKNYFYPDLPKSYQISQFEFPICEHGWVEIEIDGQTKRIGLTRIHIEEDAGKLIHEGLDYKSSYVDLNRAGVPLLEIVSEPDIKTPSEAKVYMEKIHSLVTYLDISNGDMEKGNLRCDANISIRPKGQTEFGTRTETKNLNSFRFVQQAIEYEINRQIDAVSDGEKIIQETRLYDSNAKKTVALRQKEDAHDYRYFPCPDLPAVAVSNQDIDKIKQQLPELPAEKKQRFIVEYKLTAQDAGIIASSKQFADYFEQLAKLGADSKKASNWLLGDFSKLLNENNSSIAESNVSPEDLVFLIKSIDNGKISGKIAKQVFQQMFNEGSDPRKIIEQQGLSQISDSDQLEPMVKELVDKHPQEVSEFLKGRDRVLGFFVGQIMAKTKGKANPKIVNQLLIKHMNAKKN